MSGSFAQSKMLIKLFLKIILTNKLDSNWIYYLITWSFQVETLTKYYGLANCGKKPYQQYYYSTTLYISKESGCTYLKHAG